MLNLLALLATTDSAELLAARSQMALTLGFHIVFARLGVGPPGVDADRRVTVSAHRRRGMAPAGAALIEGVRLGILAGGGLIVISQDAPALWNSFGLNSWLLVALSARCRRRLSMGACEEALHPRAYGGRPGCRSGHLGMAGRPISPSRAPHHLDRVRQRSFMVMRTMVISIGLGALLLLPSLAHLFYLFKGHRSEGAAQK